MAQRVAIPFKEVKPVIVGAYDAYNAARIQRFDMPVNLPTTDIDELGNRLHAGTVTDLPEVTITFQAMDVSAKLFAALVGQDYTTFTNADINNLGDLDVIGYIKSATLEDISKSVHVRKSRISSFTWSYSVDGEATEEYTAEGNDKRWFKYDVQAEGFAASGTGPYTLTETPIALKNGDNLISVIVDGIYFTEVASAPSTNQYSLSGLNVTLGTAATSRVVIVYHANPAGTNWSDISDSTIPAAIRGKNIPIKLKANSIPRVQSVTVRGTLPVTRVEEMGSLEAAGYVTQVPSVEVDITVLDTDTQLIALFTTGALNPADVEFRACEFTASGITLEVTLYDPAESCNVPIASGTVMKTIYIPQLTVTSEGHSTNVGGNATQTFTCRSEDAQCIVFKGAIT
jgi:hypothetical protein